MGEMGLGDSLARGDPQTHGGAGARAQNTKNSSHECQAPACGPSECIR